MTAVHERLPDWRAGGSTTRHRAHPSGVRNTSCGVPKPTNGRYEVASAQLPQR